MAKVYDMKRHWPENIINDRCRCCGEELRFNELETAICKECNIMLAWALEKENRPFEAAKTNHRSDTIIPQNDPLFYLFSDSFESKVYKALPYFVVAGGMYLMGHMLWMLVR